MWLLKVFTVIYFTACAASDPQDDPPVPVVERLSSWRDVFPLEKVEWICNVTGSSDWTFTWYKNSQQLQDPHPDPDVSLSAEGSVLTITAGQTHAGSYSCSCHHKTKNVTTLISNSVELKVYASKPKPTLKASPIHDPMFRGESVTFTCNVAVSSGWHYLWYKGTNEIQEFKNTYTIASIDHAHSGQYHCKARRGRNPFYTEESDPAILQVSDPPQPLLKLLSPWSDVFENETVEFSCEVHSADWTFTWYRDVRELTLQDDLNLEIMDSSLNITMVTTTDQGGFACKAHLESRRVSSGFSNTIGVTVYENTPKATVSKVPGFNPMYVGETVDFTCKVDLSSGWEYQWDRDGSELHATSPNNSIHLTLSDRGKYRCGANRGETTSTDFSKEIQQDVLEIPVPSLKRITRWSDVFPGESVKMSCEMDGISDWTHTWLRDGQEVRADSVVSFDSNGATLSISSASAAHRGQYSCKGHLNDRSVSSISSPGPALKVYDTKPRVTLIQEPNHSVMYTEDSVCFSCHINVSSGWEYQWLKDGSLLDVHGDNHTIKSVVRTNTGSYQCQVKRGSDTFLSSEPSQAVRLQIEERPQADIILLTGWSEVFSTDSLVLRCGVQESQDMWNYTWFREGQPIEYLPSEKYIVTPQNNPEQSLYTCRGIRNGRPSYSRSSASFKTKNLLLKRRVLLSISGFIFFGLIFVFLGCIILRVIRKPADMDEKPEEAELFLTMAQLRDRDDAPCPLVQYITDAELNASPKEMDENGICSETTPISITTEEDQVVTTESQDATGNNGGLVSFKQ